MGVRRQDKTVNPSDLARNPERGQVVAINAKPTRTLQVAGNRRGLYHRWLQGTGTRELAPQYQIRREEAENIVRRQVLAERHSGLKEAA